MHARRKRLRLTIVSLLSGGLLAGIGLVTGGEASGHTTDGTYADVQQALDAMVEAGAPGVLARIDDGQGTWVGRSGVANLRTKAPMPRNGRFRIASLTKSLVSTVIMQLAEEDQLGLDRPVGTWLPDVTPRADKITVRQLLNQTSGMNDYINNPEFKDPTVYGKRTYSPEQLVQYANDLGPVAQPGEKFSYSNAGYIVLGMLVEKVTGHSLGDEISQRVLRPARMTHSYLPITDPHIHGTHADGYYLPADAAPTDKPQLVTELNPSFAWAAYGLVSDTRDVNRFYHALFGGRLVSSASLAQMRTGPSTTEAPVFPHYGLGLESVGLTCGEMWGATGSIPGYETFAFTDESGKRRMTVSMNIQRNDAAVSKILMSGVDAFNRYLCGKPYPQQSSRV